MRAGKDTILEEESHQTSVALPFVRGIETVADDDEARRISERPKSVVHIVDDTACHARTSVLRLMTTPAICVGTCAFNRHRSSVASRQRSIVTMACRPRPLLTLVLQQQRQPGDGHMGQQHPVWMPDVKELRPVLPTTRAPTVSRATRRWIVRSESAPQSRARPP